MSNNDDINKKRNSNDEDAEYGMSVSATELNQLRQHVIAMRRQKATELLEEVDIGRTNNNNNNNNGNGNGNGNGNQKEGLITATTETNYSKRLFRLAIMSNMLFVFGAILYVCVAHGDLQWAKSIKGIPISVLEADDDAAWNSFLDKSTSINNDYGRDGNSRTGRVAAGGDAGNRLLQQQQQQGTDINDTLWVNLPTDIQLALMVLGHNQESWDSEATSSIEELPWAQLTDAQKNAAMIVGYNEQSWNAAEEEEAALANINDTVWVNLPPDIQLALMVLGHNQNSWDSEATSSVEELPWGQLTTEQKDAARIIGYNRLSWNAAKQEEQQQQETNIIDDTLWVDLPPDIQLALMVLGHNQNSWDNEATSSVEELPWSQLTAQQKNAAMIMGFDEQSWNAAKEEAFLEQSDTNAPTDDQYYDDQYYDDQAPVGAGGGGAFYDDQYDPLDETSAWQYNDDADADAITPTEAFDEVDNSPTDDYFMAQENAVTTTSSTAPPTTTSTTKPPQDTTKAPATDIKEPELTAYGNTLPTFENVKSLDDLMVWNGFTWEELPNEIQAHFEILGYNEERWDTGGTAFTENLYWDELTQPQQQAAKALGYNQVRRI